MNTPPRPPGDDIDAVHTELADLLTPKRAQLSRLRQELALLNDRAGMRQQEHHHRRQ